MLSQRLRVSARFPTRLISPRLTAIVSGLAADAPIIGPEAIERHRQRLFRARIGANENPFGPSPLALEALRATIRESWMYGDPENVDLRQALAEHHDVAMTSVVVGEGIDALLGYAVRLFVEPGDVVVTSAGAYPTFGYHVEGYGGRLVTVPYRGSDADLDTLVEVARDNHAVMIYLANPDNPMGSCCARADLEAMIDRLPDQCLLLVDEAYSDFAPDDSRPAIDPDDPRVLRFRTFSKAHGLAGLRVGYVLGEPSLIASFNRIRNHFGVSRLAQAAAMAALEDRDHLADVVADVAAARERIAGIARDNDLQPLPSATNFVTIDCGGDGDFARVILQSLETRDVFVRMPAVAPLDRCIRVSAGLGHELDHLAAILPQALADAAQQVGDPH